MFSTLNKHLACSLFLIFFWPRIISLGENDNKSRTNFNVLFKTAWLLVSYLSCKQIWISKELHILKTLFLQSRCFGGPFACLTSSPLSVKAIKYFQSHYAIESLSAIIFSRLNIGLCKAQAFRNGSIFLLHFRFCPNSYYFYYCFSSQPFFSPTFTLHASNFIPIPFSIKTFSVSHFWMDIQQLS